MRVKFTLSIGFIGADQEKVVDLPELDEMDNDDKEAYLEEYWEDWAWEHIDGGFEVVD